MMNSFYEGDSRINNPQIKSISKFTLKYHQKSAKSNEIIFTSNFVIDLCNPIIKGSLNMIYEQNKESFLL